MGISLSKGNESLKRSNVKLQAQQVSSFEGVSLKWHAWKKKTRAAIGTAGMLRILDDSDYADNNPMDNETIFHLLQVETADDDVAHLVDKHETVRNGHLAFQELIKWYEGDELTTETAEDVRDKLDKLKLSTKSNASEYINCFLQHVKHLQELDESYTPSKTIAIFLNQITDPDYENTVEACRENKCILGECIERMRAKERRLTRIKSVERKGNINIRRAAWKSRDEEKKSSTGQINVDEYKNDRGFIKLPFEIWKELSNEEQQDVKRYNRKVRRAREETEGPPTEEKKITTRRLAGLVNEPDLKEPPLKKRRTVEFKEDVTVPKNDQEKTGTSQKEEEETDQKNIRTRREILRFKVNSNKN